MLSEQKTGIVPMSLLKQQAAYWEQMGKIYSNNVRGNNSYLLEQRRETVVEKLDLMSMKDRLVHLLSTYPWKFVYGNLIQRVDGEFEEIYAYTHFAFLDTRFNLFLASRKFQRGKRHEDEISFGLNCLEVFEGWLPLRYSLIAYNNSDEDGTIFHHFTDNRAETTMPYWLLWDLVEVLRNKPQLILPEPNKPYPYDDKCAYNECVYHELIGKYGNNAFERFLERLGGRVNIADGTPTAGYIQRRLGV